MALLMGFQLFRINPFGRDGAASSVQPGPRSFQLFRINPFGRAQADAIQYSGSYSVSNYSELTHSVGSVCAMTTVPAATAQRFPTIPN